MDLFIRKKDLQFFGRFFGVLVPDKTTRKKNLGQHNFISKDLVEKKLYSYKASTFPHLQKKFQKIAIKIDIVETYPNF
jgi:hypothetical protein